MLPLVPGGADRIADAEDWYHARGLPACFQITDGLLGASDLARSLRDRGYEEDPVGRVHILVAPVPEPRDRDHVSTSPRVDIEPSASQAWIERWLAMLDEGSAPGDVERIEEILSPRSGVHQGFATCTLEAASVGVTYGAVEDGWLGLYCVVTDPAARRQGVARATLHAMLTWSFEHGARDAYLQVEVDNGAALRLYEGFGFRNFTGYRYFREPARWRCSARFPFRRSPARSGRSPPRCSRGRPAERRTGTQPGSAYLRRRPRDRRCSAGAPGPSRRWRGPR